MSYELLKRTGFFIQKSQRSIFDELKRRKKPHGFSQGFNPTHAD
jgi:hypothetical protein